MNHQSTDKAVAIVLTSLVAITLLYLPTESIACACCAEPHWYRERLELMPYEMAELATVQPSGTWEARFGSADPKFELPPTILRLKIASSGWQLNLDAWDTQGDVPDSLTAAGTFSWQIDVFDGDVIVDSLLFRYDSASQYQIDMRFLLAPSDHSQVVGDDAETVLYKEVRLYGTLEHLGSHLAGQGFAVSGSAVLRFHGRGNVCFGANDFDDWSMQFEARRGAESQRAMARGDIATPQ